MDEEIVKKIDELTEETPEDKVFELISFFRKDISCTYVYEYSYLRRKIWPFVEKYFDELHMCENLYLDNLEFNLVNKRRFEQYFMIVNIEYYVKSDTKRDAIPYISRLFSCRNAIPQYVAYASMLGIEIFLEQDLPNDALEYVANLEKYHEEHLDLINSYDLTNQIMTVATVYAAVGDVESYERWIAKIPSIDKKDFNDGDYAFISIKTLLLENYLYPDSADINKTIEALRLIEEHDISYVFMIIIVSLDLIRPHMEPSEFNTLITRNLNNTDLSIEKRIRLYRYMFDNSILNDEEETTYYEEYLGLLEKFQNRIAENNKRQLSAILFKTKFENECRKRAYYDDLTNVFNNYSYNCEIDNLRKFPDFFSDDFIVLVSDLNGLKAINDTYGHQVGDLVIKNAGKLLSAVFMCKGSVFRTGGDEFVMFIRTPLHHVPELLKILDDASKLREEKINYPISFSVGYAAKSEYPNLDIVELIDVADKKMYEQKRIYHEKHGITR